MPRPTILSDIVFRHCAKPEDAASDALVYLLSSNNTIREEFQKFVQERANLSIPPIVNFETRIQFGSGACPDIVGKTVIGQAALLIESKFWAGLTENQPIQYLLDLKESRGEQDSAILLFLVPERASPMYSDEIYSRLKKAPFPSTRIVTHQPFHCHIDERLSLIVMSWQEVTSFIRNSANSFKEVKIADDTEQLQGLVDQIDSDQAFLPLKAIDLGAEHGRRWNEFNRIQWDLLNVLVKNPYNMGYHMNSTKIDLGGKEKWEVVVGLELGLWAKFGRSPFWMVVSKNQKQFDFIRRTLRPLVIEVPPRAFELNWWGTECLCIPLPPLLGVSKSEVLRNLTEQICNLRKLLEDEEKNGPTSRSSGN